MAKGGFIDGGGLETRKKKYCVYVSRAWSPSPLRSDFSRAFSTSHPHSPHPNSLKLLACSSSFSPRHTNHTFKPCYKKGYFFFLNFLFFLSVAEIEIYPRAQMCRVQ
jgi:hypothetical protein